MANKTITDLTAGTALDGTEVFHGVQGGNSRKFTSLQLVTPVLSATNQAAARTAISAALKGQINGLGLSTNATDATNDVDIAAGEAASEQSPGLLMVYAGATGRQLDVAYGTGNGARFDTSISDGLWYIFLISNGTTVAVGMSKSANPTGQANYPSGYTHYRTIGHVERVSSVNVVPVMYADPVVQIAGVAPVFGCRAWVNFLGSSGAIRSSGNVSSVTRNGAGDYTINFATAMPDANYSVHVTGSQKAAVESQVIGTVDWGTVPTTSSVRVNFRSSAGSLQDSSYSYVAIFR